MAIRMSTKGMYRRTNATGLRPLYQRETACRAESRAFRIDMRAQLREDDSVNQREPIVFPIVFNGWLGFLATIYRTNIRGNRSQNWKSVPYWAR